MSQESSDFHQSFVRDLATANLTGVEVALENFLRQGLTASSGDLTPAVLRYWAWVGGELLRRGLLTQAQKVLALAGDACLKMASDKVSQELLLCDLRTQLLRHLSRPSELPEKSSPNLFGEISAPVEDANLLGIFTLLELSLVYEMTADLEQAANLLERASLMACRCELVPEGLQSWMDQKNAVMGRQLVTFCPVR